MKDFFLIFEYFKGYKLADAAIFFIIAYLFYAIIVKTKISDFIFRLKRISLLVTTEGMESFVKEEINKVKKEVSYLSKEISIIKCSQSSIKEDLVYIRGKMDKLDDTIKAVMMSK